MKVKLKCQICGQTEDSASTGWRVLDSSKMNIECQMCGGHDVIVAAISFWGRSYRVQEEVVCDLQNYAH